MKTFVQNGNTITMLAATALASGAGQLTGTLFGVAVGDIASGASGEFRVVGVVTLPKAVGALAAFAKIYWDAAAKNVTATSAGNTFIGCNTVAALSADATVPIRLNGVSV